jgi:ethanolamine utilization microcompartment shell protein EutS
MMLQIISQVIIRRNVHIVMCMSDSWWGFGLDIGFIDHFNIQLVITLNYSAITELHTLQVTVTHTLVFSVCY